MHVKLIFVICSAIGLCFMSCHNGNQSTITSLRKEIEISDTMSFRQNRAIDISETDSLKLYKPIFDGGMCLLCEYDCQPIEDDNCIFVAAGAYTKSYNWSKFDHGLIAGPHIDDKFYEGYAEPANSGAFYYLHSEKRWGFVHEGFEQTLRDIATVRAPCVGFSQVMLLSEGEICSIHSRSNPSKLRHRRAICDINHELYIVDSKDKVTMFEFAECLKTLGAINALYMDMGSMRYSAYREYDGGEWVEIHPCNRLTKYCSNYLVFYR